VKKLQDKLKNVGNSRSNE